MGAKQNAIVAERNVIHEKIIDFRMKGYSYYKIADAVGCSVATACNVVNRYLEKLSQECLDKADALRQLEAARLDAMQILVEKFIEDHPSRAMEGIDRAIKIQDRRAKLLGLDMPVKLSMTASGDTNTEYINIYIPSNGRRVIDVN